MKKPNGFGKFDKLMKKLVQVPPGEVIRCPLCSHTRDEHNDKGCAVAGCRCQKRRQRI